MALLSRIYRKLVIENALALLVVTVLLTLIAAYGMRYIKLDASADSLTLENDASVDYYREISQRYQQGDFLVLTYTPKVDMLSDESLALLKSLSDELLAVEGVASINSIISVPLIYSPMRTLAEQKESTRTLLTPGVDREMAKKEFLENPIYRDTLLSEDGKTSAVQINLKVNNKYIELARERDALRLKKKQEGLTPEENARLEAVAKEFLDYRTLTAERDAERVEEIRSIVARYQTDAQIFLGGVTMITSDMISYIKSDLVVFGAALILFILFMLIVLFRQARFVVLPLAACVVSVVLMLGWLSWIDWRMTVISSNFVALLLIMVFAFNIYLVVRYREVHAQFPQLPQSELVLMAMKDMATPCLYSALTTMVAFMSLVMSGIRPVIDFGWMMAIGLSVGFVVTFIMLPAGLMLLPKGEPRDKGDNSAATTLKFSRFTQNKGGFITVLSLALLVVSVVGITKLEVENRFVDYFKDSSEIYQGLTVIDQQLGGTVSLDIVLDADTAYIEETQEPASIDETPFQDAEGMFDGEDPFADNPFATIVDEDDPFAEGNAFGDEQVSQSSYWFSMDGLEQIVKIHRYLESLPEVGKVNSLAVTHQLASDVNQGRLNEFELNVMRKMLSDDLRAIMIDPYLNDEKQQTRITLRVIETTPDLKRAELVEKINHYLINEMGYKQENVNFTGMLVLYNNMLASLFDSQIATIGVVFVAIMLAIMILFRSFTVALISIIPNLLAAASVLGFMGLVGIPMDMMTTTIAAIVVGVGVDQAIQYFYRYRKEFAIDRNYVEAMHRSHASIGRAMYYTSVTIVVGFSILMLSQFIPSIYFGGLTAFAMLMAVLGSLTLLPRLILILKPFGKS